MAEITRLVEILRAERDTPRKDRLRLDSIKPALQRFNSIVRFGTVDAGDGKIQLEYWSREQIETVLSIARLIVFSSISATAFEQVDPIVVAVIENTIEFCICLFERSECGHDDLSLKNEVVLFLEATLTEGTVPNFDGLCNHLFDDFLKSLPDFPSDTGHLICNNPECHWQDSTCLNDKNPMKRVLVSLGPECLQPETPVSDFARHLPSQLPNGIIMLVKHFGIVHAKCLPRLLLSSIKLLELQASSEEMSKKSYFDQRSSFIIRVLKMLGNLTRDSPYIPFDFNLMNAVICCGDNLVALFRNESEFIYSDVVTSTDTLENQLLILLEEFIQLVKIIFCDGSIFRNIQICVIAKMLDILDSKVWRYNSLTSTLRTPLAYSPKVIMYLVNLIKDVKCPTKTFMWNEKFGTDPTGFSSISKFVGSTPLWNILSEKVNLLKKCTPDEHLSLLFPPSKHWLDDLINLAYFFHAEGIKLRLKINGVRSSHNKSVNSDADSTPIHEDEALFGDLFSEANRFMGPDSPLEQIDIDCSSSTSSNQNMLTHAATELLVFLKTCCFNPEWNRDVYENSCRMFNENHVNYLMSILSCRRYLIDGSACNTALCCQVGLLNINQACFELLHNLLVQNVFSSALEEHFVDQVLRVENEKYVYNEYTLTLLTHVLFARADLSVSQLTTKVYENFVHFITEKSTSSPSNYVDLKDFVGFLPCVFHLELLMMAFHLSTNSEKTRLASYVFSSLKSLGTPHAEYNAQQLSLWGLLASRLVLMIHHFVLYPSGCPPWLFLKFRSTLSKAPPKVTISNPPNDHPASWTMTVASGIMGDQMKDLPVTSTLFPYLIDFSLFSSTAYVDDEGYQNLGFSCIDILTSFAWLLRFWSGKKADMLEDLIIERYIFLLCWDTFSITCSRVGDTIPTHIDSSKDDSLSTKCFFLFGQLLLRNNSIVNEDLLPRVVNELFQKVHCIDTTNGIAGQGWDILRNGAWLSLVLSLLHSGLWVSSVKNSVCDVEPYLVEPLCRNKQFLTLAESAVEMVLQNNQGKWLVDILSSCLKMSMQAFQEAFIYIIDDRQTFAHGFSPCLLLKHTVFGRSKQDELLEKCGCNSSKLDSVLSLLSKLEEISKKGNNRSIIPSVSRSLLHGFPSHPHISSAILVSSALNVQDIVCVLDCLFNLKGAGADVTPEKDASHLLWQLVMAVKSDMCFQNIHEKCEAILSTLHTPIDKQLDYDHLFQLKQLEGFLRDITSKDVSDSSTLEMLVIQATELIEALRRDQSKEKTFKFYLGAAGASEEDELLSSSHHGDLLVMINALDKCPSESVNIKVLNLFIDLFGSSMPYPRLNERVLEKFISFDLTSLSKWLEIRLLGSIPEESGKGIMKGTSSSLREATTTFLMCLVSLPCKTLSEEFHHRLVDAMLVSLNCAFVKHDIYTAKSFFNFVVQLVNGKPMLKNLLEVVILLIQNLAEHEASQQALKFLIDFLGVVLRDCGATKNILGKHSGKLLATFSSASEGCKQLGSKKNTETLVLPASQEAGSVSVDCDATSADEDEEDGTSDGELASIDKDEEEDNSEKALASKVCTFTSSGSNFMEQHWYFCYTCDLTVSKGCCSVCAKVCHRGHRVVYSRFSRFFCDCGAGGVRGNSCQCLKPRKFIGSSSSSSSSSIPVQSSNTLQTFLPLTDDGEQAPDSDSDLDDDVYADIDGLLAFFVPKMVQNGIVTLLQELGMEDWLLQLCEKLLPLVFSKRDAIISKERKIVLEGDKVLSHKVDIFQLKKAYKSGSFDLKIRADYSNSRELKCHITSGSLTKSLLSVNSRGRLAVAEGDKVSIFDVGQLIGQSTAASVMTDKSNIKHLSKNIVRFEIVHLMFNNVMENYLVAAGYEECQVLTVNPRGEVTDRLAIELALQGAYIRRVGWVPGSQVQLLVVTNIFVKIYDLSQDNISPMHYFTLADDSIVDATLIVAPMGRLFLIVLSEIGNLFRLELSVKGDVGAKLLKEIVEVPRREIHAKGHSLFFSPSHRLLFLSYQDGTTLIGRFDTSAMLFTEISYLHENENDGKLRPAALHHWNDLLVDDGLFVSFSSLKQNAAVAISLGSQEIFAQNMRHTGSSALQLVGITAYKPLSKDKAHCLVLQEDGSLQIYLHTPFGVDASLSMSSDLGKRIGVGILSNKAYAGMKPEFPLDFFEKTTCITADIKLSGEAIKNSDSDGAKQKLTSDEGFLESPSPAGFKITVLNSNPDIVMVGFRLHVGNTSASHIPSAITVFQRMVKLDEGMRSWYDIPFTIAESLLADEEFTITVCSTFNGSTSPRIDCLEVYGRAKDEFGWKEKMDEFLDMEADMLGSNTGTAGTKKRYYPIKTTPIEEQLLADALKLLSKIYFLRGPNTCLDAEEANLELSKLKCKKVLEMIFEGDREAFLQSAACHVLQALFPKKEIYYHVKDTMCLSGVSSSSPTLVSKLGISNSAASWVIKYFIAKTRTVTKIALLRRSNLASFLEANGSGIVDGLMQAFWGVLDYEQPDTRTINSIVIPCVELIYSYAECLALRGLDVSGTAIIPAVKLLKELLFAPYEAVQTSSSLAISSRLLQVPFPKQTMLGTEEVAENPASLRMHPDVASHPGKNAQVVTEEDSTMSSVQYCCDGCSTVPILRRRWHCNVCPDFDLCEACYEVMDADQLPPPHSSDHHMSAIPIENDNIGGDSSEFRFTSDELNDANLAQFSEDTRQQNALTPAHVLESSETGEFPALTIDHSVVSISASKRAVNSLLLRQLIYELRGCMKTTSGARAIPLMQFFYRISSAVGGPFMDSSKPENLDLEKFVKWFLDEIDLNKPFIVKNRTFFGEISILVFMFLTLMLRNWHQPGSDSSLLKSDPATNTHDKGHVNASPFSSSASSKKDHDKDEFASQLAQACSYLRQQALVNYLMDILQQLIPHFKSSDMNAEGNVSLPSNSGCGSLLVVRRELPAGNFSPFFSDSYAKAHRSDLFIDFHKLLLENTFRLLYSLVRPEKHEKSVEKDKGHKTYGGKDLKLDGYQDILCSYISNQHTVFVRRYARRLFLHLCGSKTHYYSVRDSWQISNEVKKLYKLLDKSGGFQNAVPYERSVKLVKCLSAIAEIAGARPRNWQKYCSKHGDFLCFIMDGIFHFGEEAVVHTLKLLNFALFSGKDMIYPNPKPESRDACTSSSKIGSQSSESKKKKGEDGNEANIDKCLDMEHAVEIFFPKGGENLKLFIDTFLLEWNSTSVRMEAKCVLYGTWNHSKRPFREKLVSTLLEKIKVLPMYGQNIVEYTELLSLLLGKVFENAKQQNTEMITQCLTPDVINSICKTLHLQNELLANHPNSRIYNTLSSLVEFDGYYLESEPCVACSCPEVPYSRMKLETLKFETKFTDNRIIVKCTGSYTIQSMIMNVHDARKSKAVKVLNLYYNNRPVSDLSELKNNWSLWKRAKSCHLAFNQTELKVDFPIPITACNFMIELDSFYENLQASSQEALQCPRCSRSVSDKHGICSNCHENAYQCRQCRNINYENLDSFLCNECGYSKYGRFEFNFMARPSFVFDSMENDDDLKKGLAAIESESENAHRRYQQLMGFKKPLLKLVSSIGEQEIDSQHKDTVQQMMVSMPGPSCKINRKIALLGVLYGEKCKSAFDSLNKSVQTLQGLRRVLMNYLQQKKSGKVLKSTHIAVSKSSNNCYGCAITFVSQCMELLRVLSKHLNCKKQFVAAGILSELFENNIHQGPKTSRAQARAVLCAFSESDSNALAELNSLIQKKVMYCLEHHRSMDISVSTREEIFLLSEACAVVDEFWEARLRVAFHLLFASIKLGSRNPAISEQIILPCLRIISQVCNPPKTETLDKEQVMGRSVSTLQPKSEDSFSSSLSPIAHGFGSKTIPESTYKSWDAFEKGQEISLISYSEWVKGASYLDFIRRHYKIAQNIKSRTQRAHQGSHRSEYLALKYGLKWKRTCSKRTTKNGLTTFELGSWVSELVLSPCSQSIRAEVCGIISLLYTQNAFRQFQLLNLLMLQLPETLAVGESSAEYFELFTKMLDSHTARLFLTAKGCLATICRLITQEVGSINSQETSLNIDISQGFVLNKLMELLTKFLEVSIIRQRFMREELLSQLLESLLVIRGLIVQKTKLISDCTRLLKDLLDGLLVESSSNKRQFIRACVSGLQIHGKEKEGRSCLFILEQLCNLICPSKPEPVYLLILNKAHTQEEFIRGSMTKNPYSSTEIGPLMRDAKNKICHQLDLLGLVEDDYGMELLVAGNIISLDLTISQVYEQVWKKCQNQTQSTFNNTSLLTSGGLTSSRDCSPMTITYRLQGLDGEATEPMIKELEEEREESQDPEVEFAIAGAVREFGGLEIILSMIQNLRDDELKLNQEELSSFLNLLMYCCKIRENRRALLRMGALGLLLETARRAFSMDAMEPAEGILLIVESLTIEANESDMGTSQNVLAVGNEEAGAGEQAKKIVLMFLERLCHSSGLKKSNKQQRNNEMVARILPCLTYGEPAAMDALIQQFDPYLHDWVAYDQQQKKYQANATDENLVRQACQQKSEVENFVRVSESLNTSSCGERLKDIILHKGITAIAVGHLRESFAFIGQSGFKTSAEWKYGLSLPSVPVILSMLRGLARGHLATQRQIDDGGILPLLHALEGVSGENGIGAMAENLLDTLADKENNGDGFLGPKVHELRHATRNEMRQRALRKREELLEILGMRQELSSDGGERIVVAKSSIEGLEDVEEEIDGLACMVCREGYTLRPNDMLGVYSFSKRVNLGAGSSGSIRGECVYTTVSHFNIIHFQCHQEAKRADAALKNPKKEWEGATLRNNETLCNCIFPLRGPSVPISQYIRCVDLYWDNLNVLGRADGSRLRLLTYDIVLMLARFATGASFSTDSKGGGKESNSCLLPFMIQMACYLLDQGNSSQQRQSMAKSISAYLSPLTPGTDSLSRSTSVSAGRALSGFSDDTVQFMMVNSLLSESYDEWSQHLSIFLQRGIYHAYMQHAHGRSTLRVASDVSTSSNRSTGGSGTQPADSSKLFSIILPMLVYTGLIEQMQRFFKLSKSNNPATLKESEVGSSTVSLEKWEVLMRERLLNVKEMLGLSKELLAWLDDMTTAVDLQEAFDIMGALGVVFSAGFSTCEEFVQAAIDSVKN